MHAVIRLHQEILAALPEDTCPYGTDSKTGWIYDPAYRKDRTFIKRLREAWESAEADFGFTIPPGYQYSAAEEAATKILRDEQRPLEERAIAAECIVFTSFFLPSLASTIDAAAKHPKTKNCLWRKHPAFGAYLRDFLAAYQKQTLVVERLGGQQIYQRMIQRNGLAVQPKLDGISRYWPIQ